MTRTFKLLPSKLYDTPDLPADLMGKSAFLCPGMVDRLSQNAFSRGHFEVRNDLLLS